MRILLLSAYHSASHRYWCEGLMAALPEIDWILKTQPARHFSWRVSASGWIWGLAGDPDFARRYDLVIATSLTDVVALKALCPALRDTPFWLYFHENQFAHPLSDRQYTDHQIGWQFQSIQNALCADWISFNTAFNRDTFLNGARLMLKKFPEKLPNQPVKQLTENSEVLPVPLTNRFREHRTAPKRTNRIVWNHRWEWDKRPELLLSVLCALHGEGVDFELAMLGSGGGRKTGQFKKARERLRERIVHWGEADEITYNEFMRTADIGVSTALHDFQGLAMLELAQAGACVVVPRRLAYPECLPGACFYEGSESAPGYGADQLKTALADVFAGHRPPPVDPADLPTWDRLTEDYRKRIRRLAESGRKV